MVAMLEGYASFIPIVFLYVSAGLLLDLCFRFFRGRV